MSELQTKLEQAETASAEASKKVQELQAEQSRIDDKLNDRSQCDFDELANLKRRRMGLPEEIFTATINARKAGLAVMEIKREISQAEAADGVRLVGENAQRLRGEIEIAEKRLRELKIEFSNLHSSRDASQREAAQWTRLIAEAEDRLRDFIKRWTPDAQPERKAVKAGAVVVGSEPGGMDHVWIGPA